MQRIDENTYIDDTLVTCAEYQLFIDEMLELGKYHQPDHWNSYQFPVGYALKPILGVRHKDAKLFCEWLSKKDADQWTYRIPSTSEANKLNSNGLSHGYWVLGNKEKPVLYFFDQLVDRHRNLNKEIIIKRLLEHVVINNPEAPEFKLNAFGHRVYDFLFILFLSKKLPGKKEDINLLLAILLKRCIVINKAMKYPDIAFAISNAISKQEKVANDVELTAALVFDNDVNLNAIATFHDGILAKLIEKYPVFFYRKLRLEQVFESTLDFIVDLITLQERIAGRSPAFEGIRLVKERIR